MNVVPDALSRAVESIVEERAAIQNDPAYQKLLNSIEADPGRFPNFKIENGKIYKYSHQKSENDVFEYEWRYYVPSDLRGEILRQNHDEPLAGHFGFFKTLHRIQGKFYWPGMSKDVKKYVSECEKCQLNKHPNVCARVPMGHPKDPSRPWEMVAVDYMGPFPRSKMGNTHLLVIIDVFSKFCILKPVRKAEARSLIKYLEEMVFLLFGVPRILISDNGSQFCSKIFKEFLTNYGVEQWLNAAYHPQHNPAERLNRVILSAVRSYLGDDQRDWDLHINHISCAIRTAVHDSAKYTPYFINFGREMKTSGAQDVSLPPTKPPEDENEFSNRMSKILNKVRDNLKEAYSRYSHNYNLRSRPKSFQKGEIVLKTNFKLSNAANYYNAKLDNVFQKCRIREKTGTHTYHLEDLNGKPLGVYHANDLHKFISPT